MTPLLLDLAYMVYIYTYIFKPRIRLVSCYPLRLTGRQPNNAHEYTRVACNYFAISTRAFPSWR